MEVCPWSEFSCLLDGVKKDDADGASGEGAKGFDQEDHDGALGGI